MEQQLPGINLERNAHEYSGLNKAVGAALAGIAQMARAFSSGDPVAGVSALGAFHTALGEVTVADRPERLAFILVSSSLARALEATLAETKLVFKPITSEFDTLKQMMMTRLQNGSLQLTADIFANPQASPFLDGFLEDVQESLMHLVDKDDLDNIGPRLRRHFASALDRTWSLHAEAFESLRLALKTPFSEIRRLEIEQQRYLNHIQTQFSDEKLIGQTDDDPVLLSDVFVPLRAYWVRTSPGKPDQGRRDEEPAFVPGERVLLDLSRALFQWIEDHTAQSAAASDTVRVLSGGPGIGKSSSLKAVAAELARSGRWFPVFVPLQRIIGEGDPVERIGRELKSVDAIRLSENPLGEKLDHYCAVGPVVLFLDGLDEIVAAGADGAMLTRDFVRDVKATIDNKNAGQDRPRVIAVISGRIAAAQKAIAQLGLGDRQVLHLLPFVVDGQEHKTFAKGTEVKKLRADQRRDWWRKWRARRRRDPAKIPDLLVSAQFHDVSIEPLLFYFLVLVRAWEPDSGEEAISRNSVYRRVLQEFHRREIAKDARGMADAFRDYDAEFEIILQAMAMAAWRGGTSRIGRLGDVELFLDDWDKPLLTRFSEALGDRERAFGASLFFHARMSQGHETFEFLHKSFTEYLVARRFGASLARLARRYRSRQETGHSETDLLKGWTWTWGTRNIDADVLGFIRGELVGPEFDASDLEGLTGLFCTGLVAGYPAHDLAGQAHTFDNAPKTFAAMTDWARNAEEALLIGLGEALRGAPQALEPLGLWPEPEREFGPGNMLARLLRQWDQGYVAHLCLSRLDLAGANLSQADLSGAKLFEADLSGADLSRANLSGADLRSADLSEADLSGADLFGADLSRADLSRADLSGADLRSADLSRADLFGADLRSADLSENSFVAEVLALGQARHLDEARLPEGWSVTRNAQDDAWDITTPDGPYVDPRKRKAKS